MKRIAIAIAALAAGSVTAALAEGPAKTMDTSAGKVYVDAKGMTLYTFDKDAKGKSNCYDKCALAWPPYKAAADAKAEGEWSVVKRKDGSPMWAYEGKPVYTFVDDKKAGDVMGDGKGGAWHVVKAD
jgi:predicted lipoprotein with Yx(FWY)xxD motif